MLRIAQELRQFETIFLFDVAKDGAEARIFTPEEELDFAGHPVLGAAAVIHSQAPSEGESRTWTIRLRGRPLPTSAPRCQGSRDASAHRSLASQR